MWEEKSEEKGEGNLKESTSALEKSGSIGKLISLRRFSMTLFSTKFLPGASKIIVICLTSLALKSAFAFCWPPEVVAIVGEAAGEPYKGKVAVAEVIRRRGNLKGVYGLKAPHVKREPAWVFQQAHKAWKESVKTDYSKKATHFENEKAFGRPAWAKRMQVTARIGSHTFYREARP